MIGIDIRTRRRETILNAAVEEFCAHGFDSARMESIASRAGIGKSTVYEYFPSKHALLEAAGEMVYGQLIGEVHAILSSDHDFRRKCLSYLQLLGTVSARMGEKLLTMRQENSSLSVLSELATRYFQAAGQEMTRAVQTAQARGEVRADASPRAVAMIIMSLGNPTLLTHLSPVDTAIDLVLEGVHA